jgi:hypothetical protein
VETLSFAVKYKYSTSVSGIEVPIGLKIDEARQVRFLAKVDTGAADCIFQRDYAERLGINVESGSHKTFYTAAGSLEAYGHTVLLSCFDWEFEAMVYFAASSEHPRNVVGRSGWLQQFRLAIIEHDTVLFLSHYND